MRIIVTGSRHWRDGVTIAKALMAAQGDELGWNMALVQGCASGADAIARALAKHLDWKVEDFWPDYAALPFAEANKVRNQAMVDSGADLCLAFPTPRSRGTWDCVRRAKEAGIEVKTFSEDWI